MPVCFLTREKKDGYLDKRGDDKELGGGEREKSHNRNILYEKIYFQ